MDTTGNLGRTISRSIGAILMDTGVLSPQDAERVLRYQREQGLRFGDAAIRLGVLSEDDIRLALSRQFNYSYLPLSGDRPVDEELVAAYKPFSFEVEQLRAVRTQLFLRWLDKGENRNVLAVVSSDRGEGRSFLAANLAVVFSQLGEKTLLIDADLRAPRQHELFRIDNKIGLSSVLSGRADLQNSIIRVPHFASLSVLPAGPIPPNPQELLNQKLFDSQIGSVGKEYDVILLDTSGFSWGADASLVALRAGAALMVARTGVTKVLAYQEQISAISRAGIAVIGTVLNDPPIVAR